MIEILTIIGSRKTPKQVQYALFQIGKLCAANGVIVRSGHATGADYAGEQGAGQSCIAYLPFANHNRGLKMLGRPVVITEENKELDALVDKFHPAPHNLNNWSRSMHRRNGAQIFGETADHPTDAVLCWTHPHKGGTTQALRIAEAYGIPILNLWDWEEHRFRHSQVANDIWNTLQLIVCQKKDLEK